MSWHTSKKPSEYILNWLKGNLTIYPKEGLIYSERLGRYLGANCPDGYVRCNSPKGSIKRSHIIWWAHYGEWPTTLIDHDNLIKNDDRIENLKSKTTSENNENRELTLRRDLPAGVHLHKKGKYEAKAWAPRQVGLGLYTEVGDAIEARRIAVELIKQGLRFRTTAEFNMLRAKYLQ